jgi:hypothetical protein
VTDTGAKAVLCESLVPLGRVRVTVTAISSWLLLQWMGLTVVGVADAADAT